MKKILGIPIGNHATSYHRLVQPLYILKQNGLPIDFLGQPEDQLHQYATSDILFAQCLYAPGAYSFYNKLVRHGKRLVLDYDDNYFYIPENSPERSVVMNRRTGKVSELSQATRQYWVKAFLRLAHTVIVPNEALKKLYEPHCTHIEVIPNLVSQDMKRDIPKKTHSEIKLLWTGSSSHLPDLEILKEPLSKILKKYPNVKLYLQGPLDFEKIFPEIAFTKLPPVDFSEYLNLIQSIDADIALLPLLPNEFNVCKSNLKYLQMTLMEAACVASNVGPYSTLNHRNNAMLATTSEDWYSMLEELVINETLRASILKNAKNDVEQFYMIENNVKRWENVLV